jgi:hypothetical protein
MAAQIGNSTVPAAQKKAALAEIKRLHAQYADGGAAPSAQRSTPGAKPAAPAAPAGRAPSVSNW